MKFLNKKILALSLFASILGMLGVFQPVFAQNVTLQIPIFGQQEISGGIAEYITLIARWVISALSLLATLFIMIGGIWWLTAAGSTKKIQQAKKIIVDSLYGLILALGSYLLLATISSSLVEFDPLNIESIGKIDYETFNGPSEPGEDPGFLPSPDKQSVGGGTPISAGGTIKATRSGTPGKICSGAESTSQWGKIYSIPNEAKLNAYIAKLYQTFSCSPPKYTIGEEVLQGKGGILIALSKKYNIDVGLALGMMRRETRLWKCHGREGMYDFGDITARPKAITNCPICANRKCNGPDRPYMCFSTVNESLEYHFAYLSRYDRNATIMDAIEKYAPRYENQNTCDGSYVDIVAKDIINVAKLSGDAKAVERAEKDLGCKGRTKPHIQRTYNKNGEKGHKCQPE